MPIPKLSPHTHYPVSQFAEAHVLAVRNKRERSQRRNQSKVHGLCLACSRSMTATPLLRAGAFDLKVVPPRLPQPPLEKDERPWERAEDAALSTGAVPRRALRPH